VFINSVKTLFNYRIPRFPNRSIPFAWHNTSLFLATIFCFFTSYVTNNWLGGTYGSSGVLGTKSGGPWAAAWAVLHYLGDDGYLKVTREARDACERLVAAIEANPDLELRAQPDSTLVAFGARNGLDVFAIADELWRCGWYVDRQGPPDSLHCTVNAVHAGVIDDFIAALSSAVANVARQQTSGAAGAYGTVE